VFGQGCGRQESPAGGVPDTLPTPKVIAVKSEIDDVSATDAGVFWAAGADGVFAADSDGANPRNLAPGHDVAMAIVASGTDVFWIEHDLQRRQDVVRTTSTQGGPPTELLAGPGYAMRLTADVVNTYVAFARTDGGGPVPSGAIIQVPHAGGAFTTLASTQAWPDDIVVADGNVYWLTLGACDMACADGALWRVPIGGGPITQLAAGLSAATSVLVLPTGFYVLGADMDPGDAGRVGTISSCPPSGCGEGNQERTAVVSQPGLRAMASDGTSLFWLVSGTGEARLGPGDGAIARMILASGETRDVARGLAPAWRLAVNQSNVYWVTNSIQGFDAVSGTLMTVPNGE
jgi:hypothetical protein